MEKGKLQTLRTQLSWIEIVVSGSASGGSVIRRTENRKNKTMPNGRQGR